MIPSMVTAVARVHAAWGAGDAGALRTATEALATTQGAYDVRPSRAKPGQWVICFAESRHAVEHPGRRTECVYNTDACYFASPAEAWDALTSWQECAEELLNVHAPRLMAHKAPPKTRTLADEIKAMRQAAAKGPYHGWHPCAHSVGHGGGECLGAAGVHPAFRAPSPELLAMQRGEPAYGAVERAVTFLNAEIKLRRAFDPLGALAPEG